MTSTKRVNLALQGGGSHGAFTWGVLDALIEDGRDIRIKGRQEYARHPRAFSVN